MTPSLIASFLGTLAVYLHTMTGSFGIDDSPETISAMAVLEHQHPPGYPLFTLLGRLAVLLPVGGPGFRVALLAAVGASLASALTGVLAGRLAGSAGLGEKSSGLAGALAVLFCAFSWTFWGQALSAKGGAYTLNALVLAALFLAVATGSTGRKFRPGLAALLAGLGLAHHWMSLLAAAPGLLVWWWMERRNPLSGAARKISIAAFIALLGASTYIFLPVRASTPLLLNWGRPERLKAFMEVVTRSIYREVEEIKRPEGYWQGRLVHLSSWGIRESVPWLAWLGFPGLYFLWRRNRSAFSGLFLASAGVLGGTLLVSHPMGGRYEITEPYLVPFSMGWALATALGAAWLLSRAGKSGRRLALAVAAAALLYRGRNLDLSGSYLGYDYGLNILESSPRDAVVFCEGDADLFSLVYLTEVEDRRPDVAVVSAAFLDYDWYRETVHRQLPEMIPRDFSLGVYSIKPLRPLVYTAQHPGGEEVLRPVGITLRVPLGKGWGYGDSMRAWRAMRTRGLWSPPAEAGWQSRNVVQAYPLQMIRLATVAPVEAGRAGVMGLYARALALPQSEKDRGLRRYMYAQMLLQDQKVPETEEQLLLAVKEVPWFPRVYVLLANVEYIRGDPAGARGLLLKALELLPEGDADGERARITGFLGKLR